jgi:tetratricopeptide (TPR) repeat protein
MSRAKRKSSSGGAGVQAAAAALSAAVSTVVVEERGQCMDFDALKKAGDDLFRQGQFSKAELAYSQALVAISFAGSDAAKTYSNRSACRLKQEKYAGARDDGRAALRIMPQWAKAWARVALALEKLGDKEEAGRCMQQAVNICPSSERDSYLKLAEILPKPAARLITGRGSTTLGMIEAGLRRLGLHGADWTRPDSGADAARAARTVRQMLGLDERGEAGDSLLGRLIRLSYVKILQEMEYLANATRQVLTSPLSPHPDYREKWKVTYSFDRLNGETGNVDGVTFVQVVVGPEPGKVVALQSHVGLPDGQLVIMLLDKAMYKPMGGDSSRRPSTIVLAHRMAQVVEVKEVREAMEKRGVREVKTQGKEAALKSARDNNKDPDGLNISRSTSNLICANCKRKEVAAKHFRRCKCKKAIYCGTECARVHFRLTHKTICTAA